MSAATHRIMITGGIRARPDGALQMCCPTCGGWKHHMGARPPGAGQTGLCISQEGRATTRCITLLLRRPYKLAIPPHQIITAIVRKPLDLQI